MDIFGMTHFGLLQVPNKDIKEHLYLHGYLSGLKMPGFTYFSLEVSPSHIFGDLIMKAHL